MIIKLSRIAYSVGNRCQRGKLQYFIKFHGIWWNFMILYSMVKFYNVLCGHRWLTLYTKINFYFSNLENLDSNCSEVCIYTIFFTLKQLFRWIQVRSMLVCKRWYRIAQDEALWTRLDLTSKVLSDGTLGYILPRGVQIMRMAQVEVLSPVFSPASGAVIKNFVSKLQYLDLSMAVISAQDLAELLSVCKHLKKLSLELCTLDEVCCTAISENQGLEILNLTMCKGLTLECIKSILKLRR